MGPTANLLFEGTPEEMLQSKVVRAGYLGVEDEESELISTDTQDVVASIELDG